MLLQLPAVQLNNQGPQILTKALLTSQAAGRIRLGYPWVFSQQIEKWEGDHQPGDLVEVCTPQGQTLGYAYASSQNALCLRLLYTPAAAARGGGIPNEADEITRKLNRARSKRLNLNLDSDAYRLVWSEADGLPGFICDQYAEYSVIQCLTRGMEIRKPLVVEWLRTHMNPKGIFERSDGHGRQLEGLQAQVGWVWVPGATPPAPQAEIKEGPITFQVCFDSGHKTGFYLDQRAARRRVRSLPLNGRVLDGFAFSGGFSLSAAWAGAEEVTAIETSAAAIAQLETNARLNGLQHKIKTCQEDVFHYLTQAVQRQEHYQAVILDPPPFARTREQQADALRGHRELHRRAAQLLLPKGFLLTCSCSHHVGPKELKSMAEQGVNNAGRKLKILSVFGPDEDHPAKQQIPESRYLTCLLGQVMPA